MRYRPDLDGLRALAVLAVFASHAGIGRAAGGWMGVDIFFVLSGYLITTLLLNEQAGTGTVSLRRFYARRALRLYPALILMIVVFLPFARHLRGYAAYGRSAAGAALYVMDIAVGFRWTEGDPFRHTWSLAIEEQFYLLWPPVLLWLLLRNRDPLRWIVPLMLAGWIWLAFNASASNSDGIPDGYNLPWGRFPELLAGCCVAVILTRHRMHARVAHPAVGWLLAGAAAAVCVDGGFQPLIPNLGWQAPLIATITALTLVHLDAAQGGIRALLGWKPLALLGRRSYGFYLYHYPIFILADQRGWGRLPTVCAALAATLAATVVSYQFVERPFLRLKHRRFEPPSHRPEPVPT